MAMAALKLNITIGSLQKGQHVECKSLDELLAAEDAILTACKNLKAFLETAATFDGREVLIDFDTAEPVIIAEATRPERKLIAQAPAPFAAYSAPASARLSHADATPSYAYAEPAGSYGPPSSDSEMEALGRFFAENNLFPKIAVGIVLFVIFYAIVQSYL